MTDALQPSFSQRQPPGEDKPRDVCDHCGFIDYRNPKIVAGAVVAHADAGRPHGEGCVPFEDISILLCRRAIFPRKGYWTLPAGFMELNETTEAAACRETQEEAGAGVEVDALLAVYDILPRGQVHLYRRARLVGRFEAGEESLEVKLFKWADIPWDELAFETVHWALQAHRNSRERDNFPPYANPGGARGEPLPGQGLPAET
jgi:ADP-ribose pyrophosphatase YjhB (NUDIX family)